MLLKDKVKEMLGMIRAKIFCINAGKGIYIGKHCSIKGKHQINLDEFVILRPYVQVWGVQSRLAKDPKLVSDAEFLLLIL